MDRGNLLEDYPFHSTTTEPTTVHLVVYSGEDGHAVSAVFDTLTDATTHAQELRAHGEDNVTITDAPFTTTLLRTPAPTSRPLHANERREPRPRGTPWGTTQA